MRIRSADSHASSSNKHTFLTYVSMSFKISTLSLVLHLYWLSPTDMCFLFHNKIFVSSHLTSLVFFLQRHLNFKLHEASTSGTVWQKGDTNVFKNTTTVFSKRKQANCQVAHMCSHSQVLNKVNNGNSNKKWFDQKYYYI